MKHHKYLLSPLVLILLAGCLKTRAEIDAEKTGQNQQRQTVAQQNTNRGDPVVREKAPPAGYRFEEVDEQMRNLTGRVDSMENQLSQMQAARQGEKDGVGKDRQALEQKFSAYEDALKKMEAQLTALNEEVAKLKAPPPEPAPVVTAGGKTKSIYDQGEELFNAKKWKEAIVDFQKYRDHTPKGKQYADATYKIGVCFQELGMKDEAKAFFEEVTGKYPGSKEAKKASFRMKNLK